MRAWVPGFVQSCWLVLRGPLDSRSLTPDPIAHPLHPETLMLELVWPTDSSGERQS